MITKQECYDLWMKTDVDHSGFAEHLWRFARALESTPAQEVELPTPSGPWHATSDDEGYYTYTADQLIAYGQACASARTAPAEGDGMVAVDRGALQLALNVLRRAGKDEVADALAGATTAPVVGDVFDAYKSWPDDIRRKLSVHDLRRMGGWAPRPALADWRIDTSAGGPILVYQNCSVIEGEQARYLLSLIQADTARPAKAEGDA